MNKREFRETYFSGRDRLWGENEIQSLWDQGCFMELIPVIHPPPRMISPWFVDHRSGKPRLVVDLRDTNNSILNETYVSYEDLSFVPHLVQQGDLIWSNDIHSAYYGMSLHPQFMPYCCIRYKGKVLAATVMLLGLNIAPRIYTALTEVVVGILRGLGLRIIRYLDDFLGASPPLLAEIHIKIEVSILNSFGFYVNFKKSQLIPTTILRHLGLIIDVERRVFKIPLEKVVDIRNFCHAAISKESLRLVSLQRLIGKIIAVKRAFRPVRRLTWALFWDLIQSDAVYPTDRVHLSDQSILDLRFIFENLSTDTEAPFDLPRHLMLLFTDAAGSREAAGVGTYQRWGWPPMVHGRRS